MTEKTATVTELKPKKSLTKKLNSKPAYAIYTMIALAAVGAAVGSFAGKKSNGTIDTVVTTEN